MTDAELLDLIERRMRSGADDYLHVYIRGDAFSVEVDGAWMTRPTLREALNALYSEVQN